MPRRARLGAGLLRQHVIVIEPHRAALHQLACDLGERRLENKAAVVLILLPAAEILDEPPRIIRAACNFRTLAGRCQIGINPAAQQRHFIAPQHLPQTHRAVFLICVDVALRNPHTVPAFTITIF